MIIVYLSDGSIEGNSNSEELEDNVYIWIDSPTQARLKVCGNPNTITVTI